LKKIFFQHNWQINGSVPVTGIWKARATDYTYTILMCGTGIIISCIAEKINFMRKYVTRRHVHEDCWKCRSFYSGFESCKHTLGETSLSYLVLIIQETSVNGMRCEKGRQIHANEIVTLDQNDLVL